MAAIGANIPSLRRQLKNVACNYSDAQIKVREATSNDPWGPSSSLMSEVADMTFNTMAFMEIMQMIWKRLNDNGKNWRHVYKSLVLLDYLIKLGSDKVAQQCRENIHTIQTLKDFQHIEENKDQGMNVREKAKQIMVILKDDEKLKNERAKALMAKKRFTQNGMGIGSDGSTSHVRRGTHHQGGGSGGEEGDEQVVVERGIDVVRVRRDSELEEARPVSIGEEELQLQIALALSKEEADKEREARKHDELRLQMALTESKAELERRNTLSGGESPTFMAAAAATSPRKHTSAIDDLLSLQPEIGAVASGVSTSGHRRQRDPWDTPRLSDPWSGSATASSLPHASAGAFPSDPWGVGGSAEPGMPDSWRGNGAKTNDPWSNGHSIMNDRNEELQMAATFQNVSNDPFSVGGVGTVPIRAEDLLGDQQQQLPYKSSFEKDDSSLSSFDQSRSRQLKTPESFLGENSSLVNLDNLMGPAKTTIIAGVPVKTGVNNPFASATAASPPTANPFAVAQQRATPTLNEIRTANQAPTASWPQGGAAAPGGISGGWHMTPPLEPSSAATNPFL